MARRHDDAGKARGVASGRDRGARPVERNQSEPARDRAEGITDVNLLCAEAPVEQRPHSRHMRSTAGHEDGLDPAAIDAWYQVHHRAFPASAKPAGLSFDEVYKERYWELCFEFQTWYDMLRTRKAFNVLTGQIVNLVGYTAPNHVRAFTENDLIFPIPYAELIKDPNLQ